MTGRERVSLLQGKWERTLGFLQHRPSRVFRVFWVKNPARNSARNSRNRCAPVLSFSLFRVFRVREIKPCTPERDQLSLYPVL